MWDNNIFTEPWTKTFSQIYPDYDGFLSDHGTFGLNKIPFQDNSFLKTIYMILMGEYGSSAIMNMTVDLFKIRLFTAIMSHGPRLERELDIQAKLLAMSDEDLQVSAKTIYNVAANPSIAPTTDTLDELPTINQQTVTNHKRSKLDAWAYLESLIRDDLVSRFVRRFAYLFTVIPKTNNPLYYVTNEEEEEND